MLAQRVGEALLNLRDDGLGFGLVGALAAAVVGATDEAEADRRVAVGRGERDQPSVVVAVVAERDQALVPAAIVPIQMMLTDLRSLAVVQDAFEVAHLLVVGRFVVGLGALEEAGRWQLPWVTDDDDAAAACHRPDSIPDRDLRGLVEDHEVERRVLRIEVLRNRQGAHQQHRLELA